VLLPVRVLTFSHRMRDSLNEARLVTIVLLRQHRDTAREPIIRLGAFVQKWKSVAYRLAYGSVQRRLKKGLLRLHDALAQTPMHRKYWINGGLLLGCIRHGGPLPHDDDADFSFWEEDREVFVESVKALMDAGFRPRKKRPNNDGSFTTFSFRYLGIDFDFCQMFVVDGKMRWIGRAGEPGLELVNEVPMHGLDEIELFGRTWMKPDDHETYLEALYGDWRDPNPSYCSWTDSRAIIDRYPQQKRPKRSPVDETTVRSGRV